MSTSRGKLVTNKMNWDKVIYCTIIILCGLFVSASIIITSFIKSTVVYIEKVEQCTIEKCSEIIQCDEPSYIRSISKKHEYWQEIKVRLDPNTRNRYSTPSVYRETNSGDIDNIYKYDQSYVDHIYFNLNMPITPKSRALSVRFSTIKNKINNYLNSDLINKDLASLTDKKEIFFYRENLIHLMNMLHYTRILTIRYNLYTQFSLTEFLDLMTKLQMKLDLMKNKDSYIN